MPASCDDGLSSKSDLLNKKLTNALLRDDAEDFRSIFEMEGWPSYSEWSDFELLMLAIKHERKRIVHLLLDLGCRVFKKAHIVTPLHLAATKQDWTDVVERLIELKSRVADKSNYGRGNGNTPLHYAFFERFSNLDHTIDTLLSAHLRQCDGGNNRRHANVANKDNLSFLHIACTRPSLHIVKALLEADEDSIYSQELQLLRTPLHYAVDYGRHQIAEYLLTSGAGVYKRDGNKSTPLHLALKRRDAPMIDLLLAHDKRWKSVTNAFGLSHFMASCVGSNVDVVEKYLRHAECPLDLINARVKKTVGDLKGYTALHFAAEFGRAETVELLIREGADCCAATAGGFKAHHLAGKQGYKDVSRMLQERCDLVNKCKELRARSPDFQKWGEDYEREILRQKIRMIEFLDETLKNLGSLSRSSEM